MPNSPLTIEEPRSRWPRRALAVALAGIVVMWAYIFYFDLSGRGKPLDRIADRGWAAEAETICAATRGRVLALPQAPSFKGSTPQARSVVVAEATDMLTAMSGKLHALALPPRAVDQQLLRSWLGDWDTLLRDRQDYAKQLGAGQDVTFTVTARSSAPIDIRMDEFAKVNHMPSCQQPGDI